LRTISKALCMRLKVDNGRIVVSVEHGSLQWPHASAFQGMGMPAADSQAASMTADPGSASSGSGQG
jgi:hypothetical protein